MPCPCLMNKDCSSCYQPLSHSATWPLGLLMHSNIPLLFSTNVVRVIFECRVLTGCCYDDGHVRGRSEPPPSSAQTATNHAVPQYAAALSPGRTQSYSPAHKQSCFYTLETRELLLLSLQSTSIYPSSSFYLVFSLSSFFFFIFVIYLSLGSSFVAIMFKKETVLTRGEIWKVYGRVVACCMEFKYFMCL